MQVPTPEFWSKLSAAFQCGNDSEALLLTLQLFPGVQGDDLVESCVLHGVAAKLGYDYYSAEWYFRLAIALYERHYVKAYKSGIQAIKELVHVLEAQSLHDEAWLVIRQTEDLVGRAADALAEQVKRLHRSLSA